MFSILGNKQGFCDGVDRRNFLKVGAFGAGLTLADMFRGRAQAAAAGQPTRQKSAIMIYLGGGPSHMDMYDLKPNAPVEFRGEFKPINTNVPGIQISEHFPEQAKMFDKLAVVRSLMAADEHSDSYVMTGKTQRQNTISQHPSFGSVVSKLRPNSDVPPFVSLRGMSMGTEPGFLGVQHRPFSPSGPAADNLRMNAQLSESRLADRRGMMQSFDGMRRDIDSNINNLDAFTARAFDMISSGTVRRALDNTQESASVRDRYKGVEQFLTARRLVEAGVGCVTLSYGGWDTHSNNFTTLKRQLPMVDKAIANLIGDLHERGLQNDVVVVMWGEFGRTPRVNQSAGRDHWSPVMSALVAGGGLKMGQAVGASTPRGERPAERPYKNSQLLATLYQAVGIDPGMTFLNGSGRPIHVIEERSPVVELL